MNDGDPAEMTVVEARQELRARRLSPDELTGAVLARVERLNPALNAYLRVDPQPAAGDGPLAGIPICIKDVIDVAGMPTTAGAARWECRPAADAPAVARLRAAGAVIVGKGHTNEFAYGIDGENPHWGACSNPHDLARICGGSSSGPAVATAAGMALAGLGTDTSGSIRVPAALCGLVGIRPTMGRISRAGVVPLASSYDTVGPLCRTVEDTVLLFSVLTGERVELAALARPRLGVIQELFEAAEDYVAEGVLEAAGAVGELVPVRLERLRYALEAHRNIQFAEAAAAHAPWFDAQRDRYSEPVRARLEAGRLLPAAAYAFAQWARSLIVEEMAEKMRGLDALVAPTVGFVAPPHGTPEVGGQPLRLALQACVVPPAELGSPAVSVPVASREGLPYAMQIIGWPGAEAVVLALARRVEVRSQPRPMFS
jgi:aspartyl-tRNA(Asn)/glutamyl-tRNA(Gln) amidotransferase subunit A